MMVLLLFGNGLLGYLLGAVFSEVLKLAGVENHIGNWAFTAVRLSFGIVGYSQGVSYPITLLIFSTKLRRSWRNLFTKKSNRIHTDTVAVKSTNTEVKGHLSINSQMSLIQYGAQQRPTAILNTDL